MKACMDEAEYASWSEANLQMHRWRAESPCADCPLAFAEEQRAQGTCDGEPGEPPLKVRTMMELTRISADVQRARRLERVREARELHSQGLRQNAIARAMSLHPSTVSGYLRERVA